MLVSKNKYGNKKPVLDGIKFDSNMEAAFYANLKNLQKAGKIDSFRLQPIYELQEGYKFEGRSVRAINYVADFEIKRSGIVDVIDVKGHETEVFKIKKKMFEYKYKKPLILCKNINDYLRHIGGQ